MTTKHQTDTASPRPSDAAPAGIDAGIDAPPDPRPAFARTLDTAAEVLAAVDPSDLDRPTPASAYDVDHLTRHVLAVLDRVGAVARGEDPFSVPAELDAATVAAAGGLVPVFERSRADQEAAWADDAVLTRQLTLPFAVLPGAVALSIYVGELTIHTWDLATAIGVEVEWDPEIVEGAVVAITTGLPAEPRGDEVGIPFDPVVPTESDAPPIERLVAWTGRNPAWSPAG